ncbi:MAG: Wzz/FepE/Etk N-terminal domain-containing protein [Caldimicrobium sp.]
MGNKRQDKAQSEEIDLFELISAVYKRKKLIFSLFIAFVLLAFVISLLMPKVYRSDVLLVIKAPAFKAGELVKFYSSLKKEEIIPKTHRLVSKVNLKALSDDKLLVSIEIKNPKDLDSVVSELKSRIEENLFLKRYVEDRRQQLIKQLEELDKAISYAKEDKKLYINLIKQGKTSIISFNPIDLDEKIINLELKRIVLNQELDQLRSIEIADQYTTNKPIKPKLILNVVLGGLLGIFLGVFLAILLESLEKRRQKEG